LDGTGAAPVKNAVILIQGERITAVGSNVPIPRGAAVVDLSGYTVLPGFIDAHVHLVGHTLGDGDWYHARLVEAPAQLALLGAAHAQQTLEAGAGPGPPPGGRGTSRDRKSTRLNSSHDQISYAV